MNFTNQKINMKKFLTIALTAFAFSAVSQVKLGHINTAELMRLMPELERAEEQMQAFGREVESQSRTMITEYENLLQDFNVNAQQWTDLIRETRTRAIRDLGARIEDFRQSSEREFEQMRERLLTPIIERAREAIEAVARENNFSYIFDTSGGTLLFAIESENILEQVKRKMNLR